MEKIYEMNIKNIPRIVMTEKLLEIFATLLYKT